MPQATMSITVPLSAPCRYFNEAQSATSLFTVILYSGSTSRATYARTEKSWTTRESRRRERGGGGGGGRWWKSRKDFDKKFYWARARRSIGNTCADRSISRIKPDSLVLLCSFCFCFCHRRFSNLFLFEFTLDLDNRRAKCKSWVMRF